MELLTLGIFNDAVSPSKVRLDWKVTMNGQEVRIQEVITDISRIIPTFIWKD
jgi:hypothetical protein